MENYQITRDQIRKLTDPQVREWFPEAFENELEVGKWYKSLDIIERLFFITGFNENNMPLGFGFVKDKWYDEDNDYWAVYKARQATEEEVFEALKNEAVKRGFVEGVFINDLETNSNRKLQLTKNQGLLYNSFTFNRGNQVVMLNGKWATIIETITKQEAEKLLNKKIID